MPVTFVFYHASNMPVTQDHLHAYQKESIYTDIIVKNNCIYVMCKNEGRQKTKTNSNIGKE